MSDDIERWRVFKSLMGVWIARPRHAFTGEDWRVFPTWREAYDYADALSHSLGRLSGRAMTEREGR